jgi:hypothetical protein
MIDNSGTIFWFSVLVANFTLAYLSTDTSYQNYKERKCDRITYYFNSGSSKVLGEIFDCEHRRRFRTLRKMHNLQNV